MTHSALVVGIVLVAPVIICHCIEVANRRDERRLQMQHGEDNTSGGDRAGRRELWWCPAPGQRAYAADSLDLAWRDVRNRAPSENDTGAAMDDQV